MGSVDPHQLPEEPSLAQERMWPWSSKEKKLLRASEEGAVTAVRDALASRRVDVNVRDYERNGWTPLLLAAERGHVQVVEVLLCHKSNVDRNLEDTDGLTALHWAASYGYVRIVELLVYFKDGAVVNGTDHDGWTPLHYAVTNDHAQVVEILLNVSADPNATNKVGKTPLHRACASHSSDIVRLLLTAGARLDVHDHEGNRPLHCCLLQSKHARFGTKTLRTLQVLVTFGATWDHSCTELADSRRAWPDAPALKVCMVLWQQEHANALPLSEIPLEILARGADSTQQYITKLQSSHEIVFRRKVCLVGPSLAGKTSLARSITAETPQLEHVDTRTIGIDHIALRFQQNFASRLHPKTHDVTFWDFAGQDAYQVAHSLFFSRRTMFLVCIDLEAFTVAFLQASIMSDVPKQEIQLLDEFMERTVLRWIRMILTRQPDAEFVFIATKEDLLAENDTTKRLIENCLLAKLNDVNVTVDEIRSKMNQPVAADHVNGDVRTASVVFVSCMSPVSVAAARTQIEALILASELSFQMPEAYSTALEAIVRIREAAKREAITTRIQRVFAPMDRLRVELALDRDECELILQTLHDLGDVLWYEDLNVELFQNTVILDPMLLIDFIRQVINHKHTGQTLSHADLKAQPFWRGLQDKTQMQAVKQVLQEFRLVYSADDDRTMSWDSDLIVPAYWQTKTPASWLFLGDVLRLNTTKSCAGESCRVHWEYHFEFGLPSTLFDQLVVESVSPVFTFDAGPDWIVHREEEAAACRLMIGRDVRTLHRTIHVEAVVVSGASTTQAAHLWGCFRHLCDAFASVLKEYPGLVVSSFAWDDAHNKIGLKRLLLLPALPASTSWMPPSETWDWCKEHSYSDSVNGLIPEPSSADGPRELVVLAKARVLRRRDAPSSREDRVEPFYNNLVL